jgi:hypothetical protein
VGEAVLAGTAQLKPSSEDYDWLGHGIYFWVDSPERAWNWAVSHPARKIRKPFVLGALIYPGLCLNLTDYGVIEQLQAAHSVLVAARKGREMPKNSVALNGIRLVRRLDCAVIETLHSLRKAQDEPEYDSVFGVFDEGDWAFPGAGFRAKTHIQLAVIRTEIIVAYFRVDIPALKRPLRRRPRSSKGRRKGVITAN